jgi:hypothetical protein
MTLEDYLKEKYPEMKLSAADAAFAREIGTSRQNITRYRTYDHFPTPRMIVVIHRATKGLVDANDHVSPKLRAKSGQRQRA